MKKLRNSLMILAGYTAIVGLISLVTPMSGRGQGNGGPPTRDVNVVNPATSPVLVRDVDSSREPFEKTEPIFISGTRVFLPFDWSLSATTDATRFSPWVSYPSPCDQGAHVWCVQD